MKECIPKERADALLKKWGKVLDYYNNPEPQSATAMLIESQETWLNSSMRTPTKIAFISGHLKISDEEFAEHYIPKIDKAIKDGCGFVIGDADGVDAMAQKYLAEKGRIPGVYHMFDNPRNTVDYAGHVGGFQNDDERDAAMTAASDFDIAWVRPGKENSGTAKNLKRRSP